MILLTDKRIELQTLLNEQTLRLRDKTWALFYQHGNKPDRLLARTLQQHLPSTPIIKIQKACGDMTYDPKEISKTFYTFFSKLYNIQTQQSGRDMEGICNKIRQYFGETALSVFPVKITEKLERDSSTVEIKKAISTLVPVKSPGPSSEKQGKNAAPGE